MSLISRLRTAAQNDQESYEDVLASGLNTLFTDTGVNFHGWSGTTINYASSLFGNIVLSIPLEPETSDSRRLFAHYIWNAALIAAVAIESVSNQSQIKQAVEADDWTDVKWDARYWNVRGQDVLELGAGTALPSIMCLLSGARSITITDHPDSPAIKASNIEVNIRLNLSKYLRSDQNSNDATTSGAMFDLPDLIRMYGYLWGTSTFTTPPALLLNPGDNTKAANLTYGTECSVRKPPKRCSSDSTISGLIPQPNSFNKIIIDDCLWLPSKHVSIINTILTYLNCSSPGLPHDTIACALVISNFHTGRGPVSDFFYLATGIGFSSGECVFYDEPVSDDENTSAPSLRQRVKGKLKIAESFEIDLDGNKRAWTGAGTEADEIHQSTELQKDREPQNEWSKDADERWCLCAVLVRKN